MFRGPNRTPRWLFYCILIHENGLITLKLQRIYTIAFKIKLKIKKNCISIYIICKHFIYKFIVGKIISIYVPIDYITK